MFLKEPSGNYRIKNIITKKKKMVYWMGSVVKWR